jgi:hypothetical protein
MASYAAPKESYSSAYDGIATKADGSFDHHIRRVKPFHITNGYWCFHSNADGLAAYRLGYESPEAILIAEDRSDGPTEEIKLRWMPGTPDTYQNPRRGTAKQHLEVIAEERTILGLPASFRDGIPTYTVDSVGKLDSYRRDRHREQTESSSDPTTCGQPQVPVSSQTRSANISRQADISPSSHLTSQVTARDNPARVFRSEPSSSTTAPAVTSNVLGMQSTPPQGAHNSRPTTLTSLPELPRRLPGALRSAEASRSENTYQSPYASDSARHVLQSFAPLNISRTKAPVSLPELPRRLPGAILSPDAIHPTTVYRSPYASTSGRHVPQVSGRTNDSTSLISHTTKPGPDAPPSTTRDLSVEKPVKVITTSSAQGRHEDNAIYHSAEAASRATLREKPVSSLQSTSKTALKSVNHKPNPGSPFYTYSAPTPDVEKSPGPLTKTAGDATHDGYQQAHHKAHKDTSEQVNKNTTCETIHASMGHEPPTPMSTVIKKLPSFPTVSEEELNRLMDDPPLIDYDLEPPNTVAEGTQRSNSDISLIYTGAGSVLVDKIGVFQFSGEFSPVEEDAANLSTHDADLPLPSVEQHEVRLSTYDDDIDLSIPMHEMHIDLNNPLLVEAFSCMDCGELGVHKYDCNIIGRLHFQSFPTGCLT